MAAAAGLFNHQMTTAAQTLTGRQGNPMDSSTSGASGASGTDGSDDGSDNGATISANDFLTLLVTEMQNQDPTADTDPNEYIDQLVQVNSLEQLIDINQTLTTDLGSTTAGSNGSTSSQTTAAPNGPAETGTASIAGTARGSAHIVSGLPIGQLVAGSGSASSLQSAVAQGTQGNLSVPGINAAAQRVGHALDGRTRAQPAGSSSAAQ
jgi:flagellar basal-body rod modification protein FlgD